MVWPLTVFIYVAWAPPGLFGVPCECDSAMARLDPYLDHLPVAAAASAGSVGCGVGKEGGFSAQVKEQQCIENSSQTEFYSRKRTRTGGLIGLFFF